MARPDIDSKIYKYVKEKMSEESVFSPYFYRNSPTNADKFPLIVIPNGRIVLSDETLKTKGKEKEYTITYDVEIYSSDLTIENNKYSKMSVVEILTEELQKVFEDELGFLGSLPFVRENADPHIARILVDFTCKYKNNRIYRR